MDQFPQMLYRFPGTLPDAVALQDGTYDAKTVADANEHQAALADGFFETPGAARDAHEVVKAAEAAKAAEEAEKAANAPPTRAELETKATSLGIKFDGRISDKKLADQIAAALAG